MGRGGEGEGYVPEFRLCLQLLSCDETLFSPVEIPVREFAARAANDEDNGRELEQELTPRNQRYQHCIASQLRGKFIAPPRTARPCPRGLHPLCFQIRNALACSLPAMQFPRRPPFLQARPTPSLMPTTPVVSPPRLRRSPLASVVSSDPSQEVPLLGKTDHDKHCRLQLRTRPRRK